jgi:hypothetical protein
MFGRRLVWNPWMIVAIVLLAAGGSILVFADDDADTLRNVGKGIVIADNDTNQTGESVAKVTGYPYWISDTVGEDFNDYHIRVGLFKASQSLKKIVGSLASSYG